MAVCRTLYCGMYNSIPGVMTPVTLPYTQPSAAHHPLYSPYNVCSRRPLAGPWTMGCYTWAVFHLHHYQPPLARAGCLLTEARVRICICLRSAMVSASTTCLGLRASELAAIASLLPGGAPDPFWGGTSSRSCGVEAAAGKGLFLGD